MDKDSAKGTLCARMPDEMAVVKAIDLSGNDVLGYVDIGNGVKDDSVLQASNALVFMLVALNDRCKVPLAHFLING